jgi:hypothetical protein
MEANWCLSLPRETRYDAILTTSTLAPGMTARTGVDPIQRRLM